MDRAKQDPPIGGGEAERSGGWGRPGIVSRQPVPGNLRQEEEEAECRAEFEKHTEKEIDRSFALHGTVLEVRLACECRE